MYRIVRQRLESKLHALVFRMRTSPQNIFGRFDLQCIKNGKMVQCKCGVFNPTGQMINNCFSFSFDSHSKLKKNSKVHNTVKALRKKIVQLQPHLKLKF